MASRLFRFDEFELDEARFELRRGSAPVSLQPKALDLLLHLVRNRERVVPREELFGELWPDVVVSEDSLSKAVSGARRALGDGGGTQRFIQTVRSRGFRFVADVDEPLGEAGAATMVAPDEGGFVGREDVLAAITKALSAADAGSGRLILLAGEAGMGKTRTAREAALEAQRAGFRVLTGWCDEGAGAPALWPWGHALRELVPGPDAEGFAVLVRDLGEGAFDLAQLLPAWRARLPERPRHAALEPEQARFRLFETIAEVLKRASNISPLLLLLDDLHWADPASLGLLRFLARELPSLRLAILATYRADELPARHALVELARRPECLALVLAGLPRHDVARLVEIEVGESVAEPVVAAIHERTEGNPFFVKEISRALVLESRFEDASARATPPLPAKVGEVLRRRLDRLPAECRAILEIGALLGREIDLDVVARVSGSTMESVLALLDHARAGGVIHHAGSRHRFAHALVREVLLEDIALSERARLHRRIGEALAAHHAADLEPHLGEVAHHLCAGAADGGRERAIEYARRAGDRATRMLDCDEAASHYKQALDVQRLVETPNERLHCELLLSYGEAQIGAGQTEDGRATLERAGELARGGGFAELLARAALASGGLELSTAVMVDDPALVARLEEALTALPAGDSVLRVRVQVRLSLALVWSGAYMRTGALAEEAVAAARRLDDPVALGYALYVHRWNLRGPGELPVKLAHSDELLHVARRGRHRELELAGHSCRFLDLVELGRMVEADHELSLYDRLASELRVPRYRWRARFYRTMRLFLAGRFADAEALALQTFAEEQHFGHADTGMAAVPQLLFLRREQGRSAELAGALRGFVDRFPDNPALRTALALWDGEAGQLPEARLALETLSVDGFAALPPGLVWLSSLAMLAELCALLDDAARARVLYDLLRPHAPRNVMIGAGVLCLGSLDRYLGLLAATAGELALARRHLEAAIEMDTRSGALPWVAWDHWELARVLIRRGVARDDLRARDHIARAAEIARTLAMERLIARTAKLASKLAP